MQKVLYLDPTATFPETNEKPGYFVGFDLNSGDALTFKILTQNMKAVLTRNVLRPAHDPKTRNRRIKFRDQDEKDLEKIDLEHEDFKHD